MGASMSGTFLRSAPSPASTLNRSAISCIAFRRALRAAITSGESSALAARNNPHQHARQAKDRTNMAWAPERLRFIVLVQHVLLSGGPELRGGLRNSHALRALPRIGRCDRHALPNRRLSRWLGGAPTLNARSVRTHACPTRGLLTVHPQGR